MVIRGEEGSINVPGTAAVPSALGSVVSPAPRAIAVAGEAIVDFLLESGGGTTPQLGGGSFNAARTLGRLGLRPVFVGRLSSDRYGNALREALEESGVSLDGIVATDDPTTFARVEIDAYGAASYRLYLEGTSMAGLLPEEARAAMPERPAALIVGGLGLAVEPQASAIDTVVRDAGPETLVLVVKAPSVEVVDTVGAGDVFGAAWLGAWVADGLGRQDLGEFEAILRAAEFAALVAARTCERAGAEPPRREGRCGVVLRVVNVSRKGRRQC